MTMPIALALLLLSACGFWSDRERAAMEAKHMEAAEAFDQAAWDGLALAEPGAREKERQRFQCTWDALRQAGADPVEELTCNLERLQVMTACMNEAAAQSDDEALTRVMRSCGERVEAACPTSWAFEQAHEGCTPDLPLAAP